VHVELKYRRSQGDRGGGFMEVPTEEEGKASRGLPVAQGVPVAEKIDVKERM
jgi:hypothetical protein